jgi:uncharacterized protein
MKSVEARPGRIFMLRLEDGDMVPHCIESFAKEHSVRAGFVLLLGGLHEGEVVVGPRESAAMPPDPMRLPVDGAHEVAAVGVLAPDEAGEPVLHIHGALGRSGQTLTGCLRCGVKTWLVGEAILYELEGIDPKRVRDPESGFGLLDPDPSGQTPPA